MSGEIVLIAGSPSSTSRSSLVARSVLSRAGLPFRAFSLADFDPADVFFARADAPTVRVLLDAVRAARAIVLASPVYKASYTGSLKAIVDLIPPNALVERRALGIATTRLAAHGPEVSQSYAALFRFFRASPLESLVVSDDEVHIEAGEATFTSAASKRVDATARGLAAD